MSETEKAQVAQIRIARGRVKASMTRLESSFDELTTKNEISIRLSRLDGLFKEFERLDSTLSLEESELEEFEERYFNLSAKFNDKLDELNVLNLSGTQNSVASSITSNSNVSNFRLPKLSIPQFSGNFKDWINFKDLFVSTVHSQISLPNIEKFQYLKGLLTNEPASLIKHIPLSNDSYEEAWQKLLDRYDNKKQIVQSLIKIFLDQKPIFEANSLNLRKLLDTSDECLRGLNALGEQASSKDCWLIYLLLQKIDPESKRLWAVKSSEEEFPNMKVFLDFLNLLAVCFQVGLELERDNPTVSSLIKESFYIDDLMAGATSSEEAITSIKTLSQVLEARGFHLRKWRSNSPDVLSRISSNWWIHTVSQQVTLHGFCDASELAYASVIYAVQQQADGNTKVTLLVAKSRVVPLKPVSIQDWNLMVHYFLHDFMQPVRTSLRSMMFTSMHGLIHKWFYLGCLLIQGTGSLKLPIEHPKF
ncbi:uncharacterized protein TNCT_517331 [Trichonephila clavata]|uniref:Uncharacterized protein n=1 Tax=Trichonephila clavata TaxID=2740835 RepID=A0A8X6GDI5_TRICU|nr:uncharacterized protein TNCT_517331 [Trichonephila clavata]